MKILYFTGTGNSLYIAKQFGGEVLSIPQLIKENIYEIEADKIGIVIPIYYLDAPKVVEGFLNKVRLKSKYVFLIFTYGGLALNTFDKFKKYDIDFSYVDYIKMPENFLPFADMKSSRAKEEKLEMEALNKLEIIKKNIEEGVVKTDKFYLGKVTGFLSSIVVSKMLKLGKVNQDDYFYVTKDCSLCKSCEKVCPVNNIVVTNKVSFKNNCEQCMACVQTCNCRAIHDKREKSDERYVNRNITLKEIIQSNS